MAAPKPKPKTKKQRDPCAVNGHKPKKVNGRRICNVCGEALGRRNQII